MIKLGSLHSMLLGRVLPVLALVALASPAHAWDDSFTRNDWADGRLVDVQIRVDGQAAPLYWSPNGDQRHYFQAFAGRNYSLVLRNNTSRRIAVLLAVDGLNAVNGERTNFGANEAMYVLSPYESATIRGWRTSLDEVRRFVFVDERRSYAERTGQANSDMGWLRVLAFREQTPFGWFQNQVRPNDPRWGGSAREKDLNDAPRASQQAPERELSPNSAPAPSAGRMEAAPQAMKEERSSDAKALDGLASRNDAGGSFPGTGWGQRADDHVQQVNFRPERTPTDQLIFRYEYASGLQALGIFTGSRDRLEQRDSGGQVGFAKPPRW